MFMSSSEFMGLRSLLSTSGDGNDAACFVSWPRSPQTLLLLIFTEKISKQLGERELVNRDNSAVLLVLKIVMEYLL